MSEISFEQTTPKEEVFTTVQDYLGKMSLSFTSVDNERPWGGFFVIDEAQTGDFIDKYFPDMPKDDIERGFRLSPKILVVEPNKRLSWQYHDRRAELWRVVSGPVGVIESETDDQGPVRTLNDGEIIQHETSIRHRLIGRDNWGIVAEIWQHTDPDNPSDEDDIVRLEDDFGRQS